MGEGTGGGGVNSIPPSYWCKKKVLTTLITYLKSFERIKINVKHTLKCFLWRSVIVSNRFTVCEQGGAVGDWKDQ